MTKNNNTETYMLYNHTLGMMMAIGSKEDIIHISKEYMLNVQEFLQMQEEKKKRGVLNGMVQKAFY